jgi:Holliday junction resolvase
VKIVLLLLFSTLKIQAALPCGVYSFKGIVGLQKNQYYLILNKNTYSENKVYFDESDAKKLIPYFDKAIVGKMEITRFDQTKILGKDLNSLEYTVVNLISAPSDSLSLIQKKDCEIK